MMKCYEARILNEDQDVYGLIKLECFDYSKQLPSKRTAWVNTSSG